MTRRGWVLPACLALAAGCDGNGGGNDAGDAPPADGDARTDDASPPREDGGETSDDGGASPCSPLSDRIYDPGATLVAPAGSGRLWYVDGTTGSDDADGTSEATAFRTIDRAVGGDGPLGPGDTVRIKAGLYRERLDIRDHGGTAEAPIVVGPFGDGPVLVDASTAVTGWTLVGGQVYRATPGFPVRAVVVDDTPLFPEFSEAVLVEGRWFYDAAAGELYLWCPGGGSPDAHDVGIVADDDAQNGVFVDDAHHLTLYGLTVRFAGGHGVSILGDGVRVEQCRLEFNGKAGVSVFGYGATASSGTAIVKNGIYHNVLRNWPRGTMKWGGWAMGAVSNGTPDVLFAGNVSYRNGGEGLGAYGGPGGAVFRDNVVHDNWSVNIYLDNRPRGVIENNLVFCHPPDPQDLYNNLDDDPGDDRNLKRLRAEGIMTADEDYGLDPPANLRDVLIANNIIVNCRHGFTHYAQAVGSGLRDVRVLHNTIVVGRDLVPGETVLTGIQVPFNDGNNSGTVFRDNIVTGGAPETFVLWGEAATDPAVDAFLGLTFDHNLWWHSSRPELFHWGPGDDPAWDWRWSEWILVAGSAHGDGDIVRDPGLVDAASFDAADLRPASASSPAVDSGADAGVLEDFDHCPRPVGAAPDLGAFEFTS